MFTEDEPDTEEKGLGLGKRFGKINWLRAGILSADKVLTVSPNYAAEIAANPQMGVELDDVLRWVGLFDKACHCCMSSCMECCPGDQIREESLLAKLLTYCDCPMP